VAARHLVEAAVTDRHLLARVLAENTAELLDHADAPARS
jgi:hypothetical protein